MKIVVAVLVIVALAMIVKEASLKSTGNAVQTSSYTNNLHLFGKVYCLDTCNVIYTESKIKLLLFEYKK